VPRYYVVHNLPFIVIITICCTYFVSVFSCLVKNRINFVTDFSDITEPNIVIPSLSESDTYFAPISPAANTATSTVSVSAVGSSVNSSVMSSGNCGNAGGTGSSGSVSVKPTLLLEMLQRGGQNQVGQGDAALPPIIRAPSIRDLGKEPLIHACCLFMLCLNFEILQLGRQIRSSHCKISLKLY